MMESWASARAFAVLRHLKRLEEMLAYRGEAGIFQFHQGDGAGEGRGAYDLGGHREGGGLPAVYDGGRNHRKDVYKRQVMFTPFCTWLMSLVMRVISVEVPTVSISA